MTLPTYYSTGSASVANGATLITFAGALLGSAENPNFIAGDLFGDPAQPLVPPQRIASVDYTNLQATLAVNWPGTSMVAAAYEVRYVGDIQRSTAQTRRLLEQMSVVQANGRGLFFTFSTTTTDADPGAGVLRLNNGTASSATAAYLDNLDANGATVSSILDTWDDGGVTTLRGQLWLRSISDPTVFRAYNVTGSVVDGTGYRKFTLSHVGGSGAFTSAESLMVFFSPAGLGALPSSGQITNVGLAPSVAASALTVRLKQQDGATDCTTLAPAYIGFRDATLANGDFLQRTVTAALSLVIPSTATMGQSNGATANLYVYAIDNAGTVELAVAGYDAGDSGRVSTTILDTASDAADTMYSTTARSNVAFRKIGILVNTQATAGTWATAPSTVKLAPFSAPTYALGLKNIVGRNGGMEVWQRGAGSSSSIAVAASTTAYTADGWYLKTNANQACVVSAQAGLVDGSLLSAKVLRNNGQTGTGTLIFAFPLDSDELARLRGKKVVVHFVAKEGANQSFSHALTYNLYCGTGAVAKRGSSAYTSESNPISGSATLTTSAAQFVSSLSTAISSSVTQAELQFSVTPSGTAGADDSFTIDDVQIEIIADGAVPVGPVFERTGFQLDLLRCRPFYEKSYDYSVAPGTGTVLGSGLIIASVSLSGSTGGNVGGGGALPFKSTKRSTPTIVPYDYDGTANAVRVYPADAKRSGITGVSGAGAQGIVQFFTFDNTSATAISTGNQLTYSWTADASI